MTNKNEIIKFIRDIYPISIQISTLRMLDGAQYMCFNEHFKLPAAFPANKRGKAALSSARFVYFDLLIQFQVSSIINVVDDFT